MREVTVPTRFAAHRRSRPIVLVMAWLVLLQAFLAGFATAQAGAMLASNPVDVICHSSGAADPSDGTAPDKRLHLCCAYCLSAAPAVPPPDAPRASMPQARQAARPIVVSGFNVIISPGAVRAGPSQAPPSQA
jgi:DUF2946 family protein